MQIVIKYNLVWHKILSRERKMGPKELNNHSNILQEVLASHKFRVDVSPYI